MSVFYAMNGTIPLKFNKEQAAQIEEIVDRFNKVGGEISADFVDNGDGSGDVEVVGGAFMNTIATDLDDILQELSPWAEPCFVRTEADDEDGYVYIGAPEKQREAESAHSLKEIEVLLVQLTDEDKDRLRKALLQGEVPTSR